MSSGMVKAFVQLGTLLVGLIDKVGILQSLFIGLMSISMFKKGQSFNDTFFDMGANIKKVALGKDVAQTTATEAETASINRNTEAKNRNAQANANASAAENKNTADRLKNKAATDADTASTQANTNENLENATSNKVASAAENLDTSTQLVQARTHKKKRINKKYQKKYGMVPTKTATTINAVSTGAKVVNTVDDAVDVAKVAKATTAVAGTTKAVGGLTKGIGLLTTGAKGLWSVVSGFLKANWIGLLLTAIPLVVSLVKNIKNTEEKLADLNAEWEDLASTTQASAKEFNSLKTSTEELAPRYAELAQGVNQYGENVSLTEAEFAEFVSLQNQLAELFPELVVGYDANGNAVLNLAGDVDTLTASLKELIEARRLEYAEDMAETLPDLMENITDTTDIYESEKYKLQLQKKELEDIQKMFGAESAKQYQETYGKNWKNVRQSDFLSMYGTSPETISELVGEKQYQKLVEKFSEDDGTVAWEKMFNSQELQAVIDVADKKINIFEGNIEATWRKLNSVASSQLLLDENYQTLGYLDEYGKEMQNVAQKIVQNIDFGKVGVETADELKEYISDNITQPLVDAGPEVQNALAQLFDFQYQFDKNEITVSGFTEQANNLIKQLKKSGLGEDTIAAIELSVDIDDVDKKLTEVESKVRDHNGQIDKLTSQELEFAYKIVEEQGYMTFADLRAEIDKTKESIQSATSLYQDWQNAQSTTNDGSAYDAMANDLEKIEDLYKKGLYGTDEFRAAVQLMTNQDLSNASIEEVTKAYQEGMPTMQRYFTEGAEGSQRFLEKMKSLDMATFDGKTWDLEFDVDKLVEELKLPEETIKNMLLKLKDYGFEINFGEMIYWDNPELVKNHVDDMVQKLKDLEKLDKDYEINFKSNDSDALQEDIDKVKAVLETFPKKEDGSIDVSVNGAAETQMILAALIAQQQVINQATAFTINTEGAETGVLYVIQLLDQIQEKQNELDISIAIGDKEAQGALETELKTLTDKLGAQEIPAEFKIDPSKTASEISAVWAEFKSNKDNAPIVVDLGVNPELIEGYLASEHEGKGKVVFTPSESKELKNFKSKTHKAKGEVAWKSSTQQLKTYFKGHGTITLTATTTGSTESPYVGPNGPLPKSQARGTAFAQGNWGASKSGTALGGELGQEIVVRDGHWFTIGDHGAEFFKYKRDDIIFNAEQTKQILEKGKITTGNRRGHALASGTAFAQGKAFANTGTGSGPSLSGITSSSASQSSSSNNNSNNNSEKEESELEKLKKRYQKAISNAENWAEYIENEASLIEAKGLKVSSAYLQNQINQQHEIIAVYTAQRDALYDLLATQEEGTDEWLETSEAIWDATSNIQQAQIAIENYRQKEIDNYVEGLEEELEKTQKKHDYKISNNDNQIEYVENDIAYREALGQLSTKSHYETLANIENDKIEQLISKRTDLQTQMAKLESEGQKGTDIWYEYAEALWETEKSIQTSTTAAVEYRKEIINLYDEAFSRIGEAYGNKLSINDDAISSMENYAELLDLRGGTATKGLYDSMITTTQSNMATKWEQFNEQNKIVEALKAEANPYADGTDEWEAFEVARSEGIIAARAEMRQLKLDIQADEIAVEQLKDEFKELATQRWDDVQKAYENRDTYYNNQTSLIDSYIDRFDTLNMNTPDELIEAQIASQESANASKWNQYLDARKTMIEYEGIYGANSQEYIDKYNETIALHQEWQEGYNKVLESQQKIIDNQWDRYDQVMDRVTDATEDLQRISDLIADEDVATESGEWTDEGLTHLGLAFQQMEYNKQIAQKYADEIDVVTKQYKRGEISEKKYYERLQELEDGQWSAIEAYEAQKDVIVEVNEARIDLVEEGLDKELEAYQELIDLKKEELDSERDLYTFKKNVANQTKNIAALERRIASMSGSSDASTIAERTKLEAQLREAKESLDDTYYNHATDAQTKALDDEMKAFEKSSSDYLEKLRESIKNTDELIEGTYTKVLENGSIVLNTLETLSDEKGFTIESNLLSPWENASLKAGDFESAAITHFNNVYNHVNTENPRMQTALGQAFYDLSYDKDDNPLYEYSDYGKKQIDAIITEAKTRRDDMQSELAGGFEDAKSSITTYESDATRAVNNITEAFVGTPEKPGGLLKAIQDVSDAINNIPDIEADYNPNVTVPGGGVKTSGTTTPQVTVTEPKSSSDSTSTPSGTGPYSGAYSDEVWNLQKVLVSAFGHPVAYNKQTGQYSRTPDGYWGDITESSLKKTQKELGVSQSGKFDETTRKALSTFLTNQYNNASDNKPYETALKYLPKKAFAKGTLGTRKDQWALDSEPWLGDEIVLVPTAQGNLSYMRKGSSVMPADISANLVEWGKINPNTMGIGDMSNGIQMMSNYINKPEIKLDIENFLNVGAVSKDTLPELERLMDKKIDTFAKQLNAGIRKFK